MKKLFAVTLLIVMLCQALPIEALASVGRVLTQDELNRARALTGLSFGQDPANERAYHSGMKPNAGWTAKQLRGWLDEKLDKDLGSTCDVLSQAFYTLADMQKSDPAKYRQFTENSQYTNALSIQQKAEMLREEMRYYRDQIQQASSLIAEMSRWLAEERSAIFDSDAVRYSAKISEAQQKIVRLRAGILEKADGWESDIANLKRYLQFGPSAEDHMLGVGEWMESLLKDDKPVVKTAALTRTNNSNSRASRLQMASGLLGDADAQITVYSDNEVVIQLQAEVDGELVPVDGVIVNTRDALNPDSQWDEKKSENGAVLVPINELTADEYDVFHLGVEINPYDQGYRNIVFEDLDIERGTVYTCLLTPIESVRDNSDVERPYPYMMSFITHDIMESEYHMIYSYVNDYEIEIKVGVANTYNFQGIKMRYYDAEGNACEVGPTSQSGDVYIFKGPWKQTFYPYASEDQRPAFILTDEEGDQTFPSQLVSIKSATDDPINAGTGPDGGVFAKVLDEFTCSFKIPFVDINVSLNLPLKAYVPKFSVNPGGYVVVYVGNPMLEDDIRNKTTGMWQSQDAKDYARAQKAIEAKGAFAKYAADYALACDYYKEQRFKCLRDFSVDVGWFVVATGRWEIEDNYDDILSKIVSFRVGSGITITLTASWTIIPIAALPFLYVAVSVSLSAGFASQWTLDLCWVNGAFKEWSLHPYDNFTIDIGIMFALQLGVGVKGFLDAFVKGTAGLDVVFTLSPYVGNSILITGALGVTVGATAFFVTISKPWSWDKRFYPPESVGNLLRHYMSANGDDPKPEKKEAGYLEPQSYPALAAKAEEQAWTWSAESDGYPSKIIEVNGNMFAFSIYKVTGMDGEQHNRVGYRWINPQSGEFSPMKSIQDFIDKITTVDHDVISQRDDYDFDVYASDDSIFILATSAKEFDGDGYPVRNDMRSASYDNRYLNMIAYICVLKCSSDGTLSEQECGIYSQSYQWNKDDPKVEYSYDSLGKPHISYARASLIHGHLFSEMYGEIGRVAYPDDPNPVGTTGFGYNYDDQSTSAIYGAFLLYPDKSVKSGMGDNYEFIKTCSLMDMDVSGRVDPTRVSYVNMSSMSFGGLSQPKDGAEGDNALELFPFGMNEADRRAIVLDQGDIGSIVAVKDREAQEGERTGTTVFYTLGETNGDGATRYRLCSIHIEPVTSPLTPDLEYDMTRYEYDVVLPACDFDVCYLSGVPYLYWTNTAAKKQDSDPDVWRVCAMCYDSVTNSLCSPSVFAEFTLPKIEYIAMHSGESIIYYDDAPTIKNVMLTGTGTGYLNAAFSDVESIPEEDRPTRTPYSVCSITELVTPSANMVTAIPEELVVKAGSFDDFTLGVMNDGNMAIASLDLAMYEVTESGDEKLVETAHLDALDPTKNAITMADGTVVQSGEAAGYRKEDYDNTPRKRDWVLDREALAYKIHVADGKATVDKQTVEPSDPQHISTGILMPGSMGGFTASYKIPDNWEGGVKTLRMKVTSASTFANWMRAAALASGARANGSIADANGELVELKYVLNEKTGKLELQKPANLTASLADAIRSGLIAAEFETGSVPVTVEVHDLEVDHRVYRGLGGERWLDISIRNHAATREGMKLVCAVYVDGAKEPSYINLPYYEKAALGHKTQTISLPVSALVDDPDAHRSARVEIMAVGRDERAYANNEFSLYLGGDNALRFLKQPEDATVQEGEDVSFSVEVTGGVKPYTYQWQVYNPKTGKWVDLKGFNQPILSRKDIEKKWDGSKFRCVVTDDRGTQIVSQEVTLTVRDGVDTGDHSNLPLYLAMAITALALLWWMRRRIS